MVTHGDFTPSQLLLDGYDVGVVDLDDACRADPARDLGRYVASVALRAAKDGDVAAQQDEALLEAYLDARPAARRDATLRDRIAVHRTVSLVRSATRSCLQLKDHRLAGALALLGTDPRTEMS